MAQPFANQPTRVTGTTATILNTPATATAYGVGVITLALPGSAPSRVGYWITLEDGTNSTLWREGDLLPGDTDTIDDRHMIMPGQTVKLTVSVAPGTTYPIGAIVSYRVQS